MKIQKIILVCITCLPTLSFAFFCPTNFSQIDIGYTIDQVNALCGKADKIEVKEVEQDGPQEWSYFIPQTVSTNNGQPMPGTLRTTMTFDGAGKAVNISVNGIGVGSTSICGNPIQIGDTRDAIKAQCGDPSFINKQNGRTTALGAPPPNKKITTMFFNNTNPPVKLIFEDGILTEKQ